MEILQTAFCLTNKQVFVYVLNLTNVVSFLFFFKAFRLKDIKMGRSVKVFKRNGQFIHQFWLEDKLVWECSSYLIENQEVILEWLADGVHPKWTYR